MRRFSQAARSSYPGVTRLSLLRSSHLPF